MIHHLNALYVTEKLREPLQDSGDDLQFAALESNLAEYANNVVTWHWHDFFEFCYVTEGIVESCTPMGVIRMEPGDGCFINANVLHTQRMGDKKGTIRVIQFTPSLLMGGSGTIYRKYIGPVEKCGKLEIKRIRIDVIEELKRIYCLAENEAVGYEMIIMEGLYRLWVKLYEDVEPFVNNNPGSVDIHADKVKTMLTFIHNGYSGNMTVADIAASASISQREAYRAFKQVLGTTPILFLQNHRLNNVARMLVETDMSVTEISMACGFSSSAYMWKVFKDSNGMFPREFRRAGQR